MIDDQCVCKAIYMYTHTPHIHTHTHTYVENKQFERICIF